MNDTTIAPFSRTVLIANLPGNGPAKLSRDRVFAFIKWDGSRLSISGVEGPKVNGDAVGACGQINMHAWDHYRNVGIDLTKLRAVWDMWHLNDMQAGTPAQTECLRDFFKTAKYPESQYEGQLAHLRKHGLEVDNGYKYGTKWLRVEVPVDVLQWLHDLPDDSVLCPAAWTR